MKNLKKLAGIVLMLMAGAGFGYFIGSLVGSDEPAAGAEPVSLWFKIAVILLLVVVVLLGILLHELGHIVAGLFSDMEFRMLTVGPFRWEKEEGRLRFYWNRHLNVAGGLALCLPRNDDRVIANFRRFVAGGPLASLAGGLIALGLYLLLPKAPQQTLVEIFLLLLGVISLTLFLASAIPLRTGGFYSDGARFLRLSRRDETAELDTILMRIIAASTSGVRPRELDTGAIDRGIVIGEKQQAPFLPYLYYYRYLSYLDRGEPEQAAPYLEAMQRLADQFPKAYRGIIDLEGALFSATFKQDPETARSLFGQAKVTPLIPRAFVLVTEAAMATAEGNISKAKEKAVQVRKELPKLMDQGLGHFYQSLLEKMEQKWVLFSSGGNETQRLPSEN